MCGITLCITGLNLSKLQFCFDIFQLYRANPFNSYTLSQPETDYLTYILKNQLYINDFSPKQIYESIKDRGPDSFKCFKVTIPIGTQNKPSVQEIKNEDSEFTSNIFCNEHNKEEKTPASIEMYAACSVLHLRGEYNTPVPQPIFSQNTSNFLLYNGEIFNVEANYLQIFSQKKDFQEVISLIEKFDPFENDTKQLLEIFNTYSVTYKRLTEAGASINYIEDIRDIANCFNADFAFIFVDVLNTKIAFAKDIFGKRGLVLGLHKNGLCLSSCSINTTVTHADLQEEIGETEEETKQEAEPVKQEKELKNHSGLVKNDFKQEFLEKKYNNEYFMALEKTWVEIPANKVMSVDMGKEDNGDGCSTLLFKELSLSSLINLFSLQNGGFTQFEKDLQAATLEATNYLRKSLTNILQNIIAYKPFFEGHHEEEKKNEIEEGVKTKEPQLAILFSGGLDSTLLALLCSQILPEGSTIDLLNIAFSKDAPDRETGIRAYHEIKKINPKANLRLLLIDKSLQDAENEESKIINLIYPKITHMDFNIGAALHLASRGEGILYNEDKERQQEEFIKSKARIILSGLGADEIFGGYSRYRVAFLRGGFMELHKEMSFDLNRLWIRNLGRDDRSITANSKEVRFPFLNRELIECVAKIAPEVLTDFNMPRGTGDKVLLRNVAKELGLKESYQFKKRAIQFGTKLAKLSNIKMFGSNRKAKGTAVYKK